MSSDEAVWVLAQRSQGLEVRGHPDGELLAELTLAGRPIQAIAVPEATHNFFTTHDHLIRVWEPGEPEAAHRWSSVGGKLTAIHASADASWVAAGQSDGAASLWNGQKGRMKKRWQAHRGSVLAVAVSTESGRMLTAGADGLVKSWPLTGLPGSSAHSPEALFEFASPDRTASQGQGRELSLESVFDLTLSPEDGTNWSANQLSRFAPEGSLFAHWSEASRKLCVWPVRPASKASCLPIDPPLVPTSLAVARDGQLVALGSENGSLILWRPLSEGGATVTAPDGPATTALAVSPSGTYLLTSAEGGRHQLWRQAPDPSELADPS